jgi:hypothetical protein
MTTKRISALPSLNTVQASTVFAVVDDGTTKKVAASVVKAYIGDPPSLINNGRSVALETNGDLTFPEGTVISETSTTTVITPPTGLAGQSLVIRPTTGIFSLSTDHPSGFVPGSSITITTTQIYTAAGTLDYTFTGATSGQLGRATTGTLVFNNGDQTSSLTWTVPALSSMTTFTFTLISGTGFGGVTGLPISITVTLDGSAVTENSHIHLIAGDIATTDLFLGDDDQYVKIASSGDIGIHSRDGTGGTGATITLHASGGEGIGSNTNPLSGNIDIFAGIDGGSEIDNSVGGDMGNIRLRTSHYAGQNVNEWKFDNTGTLTLPAGASAESQYTRIRGGVSFLNLDVQYGSPGNVYGGSRIGTNTNVPFDIVTDFNGTDHTWRFDSNGVITLPYGNNKIGGISGPGLEIYADATPNLNGGETSQYVQMNWNHHQRIRVNQGGADIITNDDVHGDNTWHFSDNGELTLAYGTSGNLIHLDYGYIKQKYDGNSEPLIVSGGEEVEIRTAEDGHKFTFGRDGVLTLADPAVIAGADYNNAVHIATRSDRKTYGFSQSYWSALNGNALRINTGSGNAQDFACTVSLNVNGTYSVTVANSGNSFAPGDWFTIPGTELGGLIGVPPAGNDLKITVATVDGGGAILTTTLLGTNGSKEWTFGTGGDLQVPGGVVAKDTLTLQSTEQLVEISTSGTFYLAKFGDIGTDINDEYGSYTAYDSKGNLYVVGGTSGGPLGFAGMINKYDPQGNLLYQNIITNIATSAEGIYIDANDHVFVMLVNDLDAIGYVVRLDDSGHSTMWQTELDFNTSYELTDITGDGNNIYVMGDYSPSTGNKAIYVIKLSASTGSVIWNKQIQGDQDLSGLGIVANSNGIWISGTSGFGLYVTRLNIDGSINWQSKTVGPVALFANMLDPTGQHLIVSGVVEDAAAVFQINAADGTAEWYTTIDLGGNQSTVDFAVAGDADGNIYVAGTTFHTTNNVKNIFIAKLDGSGDVLWQRTLGNGTDKTDMWNYYGHRSLAVYKDRYAITGYTNISGLSQYDMIVMQMPTDGSLTRTMGSFLYQEVNFATAYNQSWSLDTTTYTIGDSEITSTGTGIDIGTNTLTNTFVFRGTKNSVWQFTPSGEIIFPDGTIQSTASNGAGGVNLAVTTPLTLTKQKIQTFSGTTARHFTGTVSSANNWNWLSWVDDLPFFTEGTGNGVRGGKVMAYVLINGSQSDNDYIELSFSADYGPFNPGNLLAGQNGNGIFQHYISAQNDGLWTQFTSTATGQDFTVEITYTVTLFFGQETVWG